MKKNISFLIITMLFAAISFFLEKVEFININKMKEKKIVEEKISIYRLPFDKPREAARFDYEMRAYPIGYIPIDWREKALTHIKNFNTDYFKKSSILTWQPLGPINIAGRTRTIKVNPSNTQIVYAGAVSGGIWKSTDAGENWTPIGDLLENLAICAIEIDPSKTNIIYAGSGEGYFNYDAVRGEGIFKSSDSGNTWVQLASTKNSDFYYVNDLQFDKTTGKLWAATNNGLYYTQDGGVSWNLALNTPTNGRVDCTDIEITKTNPSVIFACYGIFSTSYIYRSTNSGLGFSQIFSSPTTGRVELAIAPSNPSIIYTSFMHLSDYDCGRFMKSTNGGNSFLDVAIPGPSLTYSTYTGPQAWYDNIIAVDPADPNRVFAGGVDLFVSQNGGSTWIQRTNWYSGTPYQYAHADHHSIEYVPGDNYTFYLGTDGGIFTTTNGGLTFTEKTKGLTTVQFYSGASHPTQNIFYGGTQDNGTLKSDVGQNWKTIIGGDGGCFEVDYDNPNIVYGEYVNLAFFRSINAGMSFQSKMNGIPYSYDPAQGTTDRVRFIAPFVMDPNYSQILVAGTYRIFRTMDGANNWSAISGDLTGDGSGHNGAVISALAIAKGNSNIIFAGCSNGRIQKTTNAGITWNIVSDLLPQLSITDLEIDPSNNNTVYVTFSGFSLTQKVYRSTNSGISWTNISGNLPNVPANCILIDPLRNNHLFLGTDVGIFQSIDGGSGWIKENNGIGNVRIDDLDLRKFDFTVIAASHGRGMYKTQISSFINENGNQIPDAFSISQNYPNPFNPATTIKFSLPKSGNVKINIYDLNGSFINNLIQQELNPGTYSVSWNGKSHKGNTVASGSYIYRIESGEFNQSKKMLLIR